MEDANVIKVKEKFLVHLTGRDFTRLGESGTISWRK